MSCLGWGDVCGDADLLGVEPVWLPNGQVVIVHHNPLELRSSPHRHHCPLLRDPPGQLLELL